MLKYAREDTHYLLTIYDKLRIKLMQRSLFKGEPIFTLYSLTYNRSNELALKQYYKPNCKLNGSYYSLIERNALILSKKNLSIFKILYKFRDYIGRKVDKNPNIVMNNNQIFKILKNQTIQIEHLYESIDKKEMRSHIPELWNIIQEKLKKIQEKEKVNKSRNLEEEYKKTVENLNSARDTYINNKSTHKLKSIDSVANSNTNSNTNANTKANKSTLTFNNLISQDIPEIKINEFDKTEFLHKKEGSEEQSQSKSTTLNEQDNTQDEDPNSNMYIDIVEKFSNFNIVNFLKDKLKLKIVYKENIDSSNNLKNDTKESNERNESSKIKLKNEDNNIMTQKLPNSLDKKFTSKKREREREMYDMTDMDNLTKKLITDQSNKNYNEDDESVSDEDNDKDKLVNKKAGNKNKPDMNYKNIKQKTNLNLEASSSFIEKSNLYF